LLIYVQEGHCKFTVDGIPYDFRDGEFCLIQPNSVHSLEGLTPTITPFAHMDWFYSPNRADSFPTKPGQVDLSAYASLLQPRFNDLAGTEVPVKFRPQHSLAFRDTMLTMIECWHHQDDPLQLLRAQTHALELVLAIMEAYAPIGKTSAAPPHALNWVTSYMSFRLADKISVSDMARRAHLSPSRFNVVFRERFGVAPHRYLLELRLKHAEELLRSGETPLADIASYCGFADIHHFTKTFKQAFGESPGAYRKRKEENPHTRREFSVESQPTPSPFGS
jgi:AraC-like DNA-binding protein